MSRIGVRPTGTEYAIDNDSRARAPLVLPGFGTRTGRNARAIYDRSWIRQSSKSKT